MDSCKQAILTAMILSNFLSEQFIFSELLETICQEFGTEYTANCLLDLRLI